MNESDLLTKKKHKVMLTFEQIGAAYFVYVTVFLIVNAKFGSAIDNRIRKCFHYARVEEDENMLDDDTYCSSDTGSIDGGRSHCYDKSLKEVLLYFEILKM